MESKTLFLLIGQSGSGKSYLERNLHNLYPFLFSRVISFTTREPREGEVDGVDFLFITKEKYNELKEKGSIIQEVNFAGNIYGSLYGSYRTKEPYITLVCTPQIANFIPYFKRVFPTYKVKIIYFDISEDRIRQNMRKRGDSEEMINARLAKDNIKKDFETSNLQPDLTVTDDVLDETLPERFIDWIIKNKEQT